MAEAVGADELAHAVLVRDRFGVAHVLDDLERATGRLQLDARERVARVDPVGERLWVGDSEPGRHMLLPGAVPRRVLDEVGAVLERHRPQRFEVRVQVSPVVKQGADHVAVAARGPVEGKAGAVPPAVALRGHHRREVLADVAWFVERPARDAAHSLSRSLSHTVHETRMIVQPG